MTLLGFVSDYMENGTLRDYIENYNNSPISEAELFSLVRANFLPVIIFSYYKKVMGVAEGLKAIHEMNIIHRDIKSFEIIKFC